MYAYYVKFLSIAWWTVSKHFSRVEMSALIRSPCSRGTTTVRRSCQQRQLQGHRNRQRQQLHQLLTSAAKCASWRHVLASHWCRADMRVLWILCYARVIYGSGMPCLSCGYYHGNAHFLIWQTMLKYTGDIQPTYCYFCAVSLLCIIKNHKHVDGIYNCYMVSRYPVSRCQVSRFQSPQFLRNSCGDIIEQQIELHVLEVVQLLFFGFLWYQISFVLMSAYLLSQHFVV